MDTADLLLDERAWARRDYDDRVLYVAWQNPATRTITPVGRLTVGHVDGQNTFEFRYLARAQNVLARPFTGFPDFDSRYTSARLFPFFENRMVPVDRSDFGGWAASVGLDGDADPFEVLASSGGMRATDTLEVFSEPLVDLHVQMASFRCLVRGVRHVEGADDQIDRLRIGNRLALQPEPKNDVDTLAVLVLPDTGQPIGWVPAYLCAALHRSAGAAEQSWHSIATTVRHVGDRDGPSHFRLLCEIAFPWPFQDYPFDTPEFAVTS